MAKRKVINKWKTPKMTIVCRSDDSETALNNCKDDGCYVMCAMYMPPPANRSPYSYNIGS
jgi:hypothetical protein